MERLISNLVLVLATTNEQITKIIVFCDLAEDLALLHHEERTYVHTPILLLVLVVLLVLTSS